MLGIFWVAAVQGSHSVPIDVSPAPGSAGVGCQGLVEGQLTEPETLPHMRNPDQGRYYTPTSTFTPVITSTACRISSKEEHKRNPILYSPYTGGNTTSYGPLLAAASASPSLAEMTRQVRGEGM